MSAARRGADFERRVRRYLEQEGWFVVRSAGSRGPVDLVAVRRSGQGGCEVRLIQCIVAQPRFTVNDWSLLVQAALDAGATAWLASRDRAASHHAVAFKSAALEDAPHRLTDDRWLAMGLDTPKTHRARALPRNESNRTSVTEG